jgi:hypothetical protein
MAILNWILLGYMYVFMTHSQAKPAYLYISFRWLTFTQGGGTSETILAEVDYAGQGIFEFDLLLFFFCYCRYLLSL